MNLIYSNGDIVPILKTKAASGEDNPWEMAHSHLDTQNNENISYIEPDLNLPAYVMPETQTSTTDQPYLRNWPEPPAMQDRLLWHLSDTYSQLRKACHEVESTVEAPAIRIALIDTGFQHGHPFLPRKLQPGVSFMKGEEGGAAHDALNNSLFEQQGHGTATACILAGGNFVTSDGSENKDQDLGAIPFAEIIPIRISDTVALIRTKAFVDAVRYAISQGCEVISMSMAGAPAGAWAEAVNLAYNHGVVLVTAAGNSWFTGAQRMLPKRVLYPARWQRVIAATGVAADHEPYSMDARLQYKSEGGETMQGNYGPDEAMLSAIAAYTPNVVWATLNNKSTYYRLDGGGTSSATPQVAAAAALWIVKHREKIDDILKKYPKEKWRKVEMVKKALFSSADTSYPAYRKYFGNGVLRAYEALAKEPDENVSEVPKARVSFWGVADLLGLLLKFKNQAIDQKEEVRKSMFETEIVQEMIDNPKLSDLLKYDENEVWTEADCQLLKNELQSSKRISKRLAEFLSTSDK